MKYICKVCKEPYSYNNTRTEAGIVEWDITCICEKCFDNLTFNVEENIEELNSDVLNIVGNGVVLAGGALRNCIDPDDTICDYDLFFTDLAKVDTVRDYFEGLYYDLIFVCPKGELYTYINADGVKVQLITKKVYSSAEEIAMAFDICACCASWDGNVVHKHERFVFDNLNKLININKIEFPVASMKRIAKYIKKGFHLTPEASLKFVSLVNGITLTEDNTRMYVD